MLYEVPTSPGVKKDSEGRNIVVYSFKGCLTRDFRLQVFFINQCPPGPQVPYSIGAVLNFFENLRRNLRMNVYHQC
jgi:hypothetical protein